MKPKFADKILHSIFILVFVMGTTGMPGASAKALGNEPSISVLPQEDVIHAFNWPLGVLLMLDIDDPGTSQTPDYTTSHVVLGPNNYEEIELGGIFDIQPGYLVTVSDGNTTRQHTVTHLAVTNIDMDADTIYGIANPGSSIYVTTNCDANGCARRNVIADEQGNWLANFSIPVSEPSQGDGVFDVRLASGGTVHELDKDGDTTRIPWIMIPPTIGVDVDIDRVQGWDWPLGATVSFEIDDPLTSENPDYTNSVTVEAADWDPNLMYFWFYTNDYDLKPGDIVTAMDGNITKQLIVTHFRITAVDLNLDTVYGVANPGQDVRIWHNNPHASRLVTADEDGNWSANFAVSGDEASEQETVDIRNGSDIDSFVGDEDWDNTRCLWRVPNPTIGVRANYDQIEAYQWDMGDTLTLEIDNPNTADTPDYTATQTVTDVASWDPSQTYMLFNLSGAYDIQIGDVVEINNGLITKATVVSNLTITNVHLDTDMVEGMAEPGQTINVWTCWQDICVNRDETADPNGNWVTNFAVPGEQDWEQGTADLGTGSWIDSSVSDDDWDSIMFGWFVDIPNIEANTGDNGVVARGWPNGTPLTLTINDPSNGPSVDKTVYATMGPSSWDPNDIAADFTPMLDFDLQPGYILKVTDGTTEAMYVPTNLTVTGFDLDADTISGTAKPGVEVEVWVGVSGPHVLRYVTSDAVTGKWIVDYGHFGERDDEQQLVDLQFGSAGFVKEFDANRNATHVDWRVPYPPLFMLNVDNNSSWRGLDAWNWPLGSQVTLTVDDPGTNQNPDYTEVQTMAEPNPGQSTISHAMYMQDYELGEHFIGHPGFNITLSDGVQKKAMIVPFLSVTGCDLSADTVIGVADPLTTVTVAVGRSDPEEYAERNVVTDQQGNWLANFAVSNNSDEAIYDLRSGDYIEPLLRDDDRDFIILRNWIVPHPPLFMLNVDNNSHWQGLDVWNWPSGSQVTLSVDDPNATQNPVYTEVQTMMEGNGRTHAMYMQDNNLEGKPGYIITLSDGIQTKSMIVPTLTIMSYDLDNDTISGVSDPFTRITIPVAHCINEYDCSDWVERTVTSDSEGNWEVNFAISNSPGEVTFDLQPGDIAEAQIFDEDQDHIVLRDWRVQMDTTPPTITWVGDIDNNDSLYFGFVPAGPTCIATDSQSGVDEGCTVSGYQSTIGSHTLIATAKDKAGNEATEYRNYTVSGWTLKGFYQPVDMNGILNVVKNGSTVPVKFEIFAGSKELTDTADVESLTPVQVSCNTSAPTDQIETTVTGGTSLRYDAVAGQFIYNWKTPKAAGNCYRVTMTTIDGSSLVAYFKLK